MKSKDEQMRDYFDMCHGYVIYEDRFPRAGERPNVQDLEPFVEHTIHRHTNAYL